MRFHHFTIIILSFCSCIQEKTSTLDLGYYRVILNVQDNEKLPFIIQVTSKNTLEIYNAEEVIHINEVKYSKDSVYIRMLVFEGYIADKITNYGFEGQFIKESLDQVVSISARKNNQIRFFSSSKKAPIDMSGVWKINFSGGSDTEQYTGKGIFKQTGNYLSGTIRTATGDYRYLEGIADGNLFKLSVFDGAHAFLFSGK